MAHSLSLQFEFCADRATKRSVGGPFVCALLDRNLDHLSADADARHDDAFNALMGHSHDEYKKNLRTNLVPAVVLPVAGLITSAAAN
jgi:hypothetical protein